MAMHSSIRPASANTRSEMVVRNHRQQRKIAQVTSQKYLPAWQAATCRVWLCELLTFSTNVPLTPQVAPFEFTRSNLNPLTVESCAQFLLPDHIIQTHTDQRQTASDRTVPNCELSMWCFRIMSSCRLPIDDDTILLFNMYVYQRAISVDSLAVEIIERDCSLQCRSDARECIEPAIPRRTNATVKV